MRLTEQEREDLEVAARSTGLPVSDLQMNALTAAVESILAEQREQIVQEIRGGRDSFLSSDNLDPAWIAGWHSATDHHAHRIVKGGK